MAFQLKPGKPVGKQVARLACKQIDNALHFLEQAEEGSSDEAVDEAVHGARKCFKKMRAILRLAKPAIGRRIYRRENIRLRDAGRPLTEVRDAKILVEALDKLAARFEERLRGQSFAKARAALQAHQRDVRRRVLQEQKALAGVLAAVRESRDNVAEWTDVPNRWSSLGDGIKDVYRQARHAFETAKAIGTNENLHEWRKQSKYLRYQLEILEPLWPAVLKGLAEQADRQGTLLGDDHDLAVLTQMVDEDPDRYGDPVTLELLRSLINGRRAGLQAEAMSVGQRFYQGKPNEFFARLKGFWQAWRAENANGRVELHPAAAEEPKLNVEEKQTGQGLPETSRS